MCMMRAAPLRKVKSCCPSAYQQALMLSQQHWAQLLLRYAESLGIQVSDFPIEYSRTHNRTCNFSTQPTTILQLVQSNLVQISSYKSSSQLRKRDNNLLDYWWNHICWLKENQLKFFSTETTVMEKFLSLK